LGEIGRTKKKAPRTAGGIKCALKGEERKKTTTKIRGRKYGEPANRARKRAPGGKMKKPGSQKSMTGNAVEKGGQ